MSAGIFQNATNTVPVVQSSKMGPEIGEGPFLLEDNLLPLPSRATVLRYVTSRCQLGCRRPPSNRVVFDKRQLLSPVL